MQRRKAFSYLRFSSPEQSRGASSSRQSDKAEEYARQNGFVLDEKLRDEGVSAFRGRHRDPTSALGSFLAKVARKEVPAGSVLIVESLDRLSREQVLVALQLLISLVNADIEVVTLTDGRSYRKDNLQDGVGLIISISVMIRAHDESLNKSKHVADAWRRKKQAARDRGQAMTARCPGWIRLVGGPRTGHYELIPERAELVRDIFEWTIAGDGRRTITKRLNDRNEEPWGVGKGRGMYWHDSYVAKLLRSPASFGRYERAGAEDVIDGYFPAAVNEATYWKAQAATSDRVAGQGRSGPKFSNLLKGLARCEACGGNLVYVDKGKRSNPSLVCASSRARGGCQERHAFPYDGLERMLVHALAHFADAALFSQDERQAALEISMSALERKRDDLVARRDNLWNAAEGGEALPGFKERMQKISAALRDAEQELRAAKSAAAEQLELGEDIEQRVDVIEEKLYADDPEERYRGRSLIHSRLAKYIDHVTLRKGRSALFLLKPEWAEVDAKMMSTYGPVVPDGDDGELKHYGRSALREASIIGGP